MSKQAAWCVYSLAPTSTLLPPRSSSLRPRELTVGTVSLRKNGFKAAVSSAMYGCNLEFRHALQMAVDAAM